MDINKGRFGADIGSEYRANLESLARIYGVSMTEMIRLMIDYFKQERPAGEIMRSYGPKGGIDENQT